jgi:hypothetical protein
MQRIRVERERVKPERRRLEILPLDPRDLEIVRAKDHRERTPRPRRAA